MLGVDIRNLVIADPTFISLAGDRLYPVLLPEDAPLPSATYQVISTLPLYASGGRVAFTQTRLEIDTWADTYQHAKTLATAISNVLDDYSGGDIEHIAIVTSQDLYEPSARVYRVRLDYLIQHS